MAFSALQIDNRTYKGISNVILTQNSTNQVFALPTATGFVIDSGRNERTINNSNQLGENVFANSFNVESMPTLQLTYGVYNTEMYAIQENVKLETGMLEVKVPYKVKIPKTGMIEPATVGKFLYAITKDSISYGSIVVDNKSYEITRVAYDTFDDTVDDQFAVGDNGAFLFSQNLYDVNDPPFVNLEVETIIEGNYLGSVPIGDMRVNATLVTSNNTITYVQVPRAIVNTSGISFDAKAEGTTLNMRLATEGCRPFQLLETKEVVDC